MASPAYQSALFTPYYQACLACKAVLFFFFHLELLALKRGDIVLHSPLFSKTLVHFQQKADINKGLFNLTDRVDEREKLSVPDIQL